MLSQTFHYSVASVVSAAIGLLSAVVFTRLLTPEEYGVYVVGLSTAGIVSALLFTWVRVSALRFQSEGGAVDVRKTIFVAYLISALAAPVALLVATLTTSVSLERNLAAIFFALGLGLFELGQELLKARLQSFAFMSASIIRACLAFTLCLAAALLGGGGLCQLAMVTITYFVTTMLFAGTILRSPVAGPKISDLRTFAGFGIPITLSGIVFALHAALDRMLVFHFMGDHAAGQYGASADLVRQIILIPAVSIASATIPLAVRAYATGGAGEARPHLEFSLEILLAAVLPAVAGVALTSSYIAGVILGSEFRETAAQIMPILAFAWLFQSISQSYIHASFHLAKTPFMMTTQSIAMLIANLLVMPVLLARFGLVGAASSLVIVEACGAGFGWYLTRKAFPLPFNAFQVMRIVAATAIMALVLTFAKPLLPISIVSFGVLAATGCLVYVAAAVRLRHRRPPQGRDRLCRAAQSPGPVHHRPVHGTTQHVGKRTMMRLASKTTLIAADHRHVICRTNSVSLSDFTDKRREATRPLAFRGENFERDFDSNTLFYDAVQVSKSKVALFAPPFFNLARDVATTTFISGAGTLQGADAAPRPPCPIVAGYSRACRPDPGLGELGSFTFSVSPNESEMFRDRRVIFTMSKDNPIEWILDWVRFNRDIHGADAVLIYDNGSSAYDSATLSAALRSVPGIRCSVVMEWPFKYGPQGANSWDHWDSDFCQLGAWEHARWRFLQNARSAMNSDIDELVLSKSGRSVFEAAEQSWTGLVRYRGRWIIGIDDGLREQREQAAASTRRLLDSHAAEIRVLKARIAARRE